MTYSKTADERHSTTLVGSGFALLIFIAGAVTSLFAWAAGLALILISIGVACISRYRAPSTGFAGALALIPALLIFLYVYGSWDRESPVYRTNVPPSVWIIITVGMLSLVFGLLIAGGARSSEPTFARIRFEGSSAVFFWVGVVGVAIGALNYATGVIPLLSGDVNSARFSGGSGILARFWLFAHPAQQISILVCLLKLRQRQVELHWICLGLLSAVSLGLSGARSLLAIALIAFGVIYVESRRPQLKFILLASVVGILAVGGVGRLRALFSPRWGGLSQYERFMAKRGLDNWFGSTDISLQTGPRVMTKAIEVLKGDSLGGQIFLGDIPRLGEARAIPGDQLVTLMIGRDPAVVGGSPPTVFGGLYLDFGWLGVVFGAALAGFLLAYSRRLVYEKFTLSAVVWFGYFASYVAVSGYSYLSLKPAWIIVLLVCILARIASRGESDPHSSSVQVQRIPWRGRTSSV